jgi:hypothetical protein
MLTRLTLGSWTRRDKLKPIRARATDPPLHSQLRPPSLLHCLYLFWKVEFRRNETFAQQHSWDSDGRHHEPTGSIYKVAIIALLHEFYMLA